MAFFTRKTIVFFGFIVSIAALCTGFTHRFAIGSMYGFFPPHYGYSAYVESATWFFTESTPIGYLIGIALLLSDCRDAWLGIIIGWAYMGSRRRRLACVILGPIAIAIGLVLKPNTYNDYVRVGIWKAVIGIARENPGGVDLSRYFIMYEGKFVNKAHSDVLQVLLQLGFERWVCVVVFALGMLFYALKGNPTAAKAALLCLTVQSVFDNRLHRHVCVLTYCLVWGLVLLEKWNRQTLFELPARPPTS